MKAQYDSHQVENENNLQSIHLHNSVENLNEAQKEIVVEDAISNNEANNNGISLRKKIKSKSQSKKFYIQEHSEKNAINNEIIFEKTQNINDRLLAFAAFDPTAFKLQKDKLEYISKPQPKENFKNSLTHAYDNSLNAGTLDLNLKKSKKTKKAKKIKFIVEK